MAKHFFDEFMDQDDDHSSDSSSLLNYESESGIEELGK